MKCGRKSHILCYVRDIKASSIFEELDTSKKMCKNKVESVVSFEAFFRNHARLQLTSNYNQTQSLKIKFILLGVDFFLFYNKGENFPGEPSELPSMALFTCNAFAQNNFPLILLS